MAVNINIPSQVTQTITDGVTSTAPSEDAVFNALAEKANSADLAEVATSGDYNDLINQPTIPVAQVNSDWDATSGVAEILNKPTIPAAQVNSDWNATSGVAEILNKPTIPSGTVTSVGLTMPSAFNVADSPVTNAGTLAVTGAGLTSQYVRGDGSLGNFPNNGGGGSSVNYYLNGSVSQGTFGGSAYYELSKTPVIGAGTNFTRTNAQGNGYIASFITDAGDPNLLNIPGGNWNLEFYFNSSSSGGSPSFYAELYKVDLSNAFTLIASGSTNPEGITNGTTVDQYFTSIPVPQTTILATDRIAIRIFVIPGGRNITLHTEDNNLSQIITTFSTGLNALNGLTDQVQYFALGQLGTVVNWSSVGSTHTLNIPIKYTIELMDALTVDFYAPYNMSIDSVTNIKNSPTITLQDDGAAYTLGASIAVGSKITVTASVASVVTLNVIRA